MKELPKLKESCNLGTGVFVKMAFTKGNGEKALKLDRARVN